MANRGNVSDFDPEEMWIYDLFEELRSEFYHDLELWSDILYHKIEDWHANERYRHRPFDTMFSELTEGVWTAFNLSLKSPRWRRNDD